MTMQDDNAFEDLQRAISRTITIPNCVELEVREQLVCGSVRLGTMVIRLVDGVPETISMKVMPGILI